LVVKEETEEEKYSIAKQISRKLTNVNDFKIALKDSDDIKHKLLV